MTSWRFHLKRRATIRETVDDIAGAHSNGISVYMDSADILVAGNRVTRSPSPFTFEASSNITVVSNVFDAGDGRSNVNEWGSDVTGTVIFASNTLPRNSRNASLNIGNNIYTGLEWCQDESDFGEGDFTEEDLGRIFIDAAAGNFDLFEDSVAVDAGSDVLALMPTSTFPDYDFTLGIRGVPRPQGAAWDIGAYEYTATPPPDETVETPAAAAGAAAPLHADHDEQGNELTPGGIMRNARLSFPIVALLALAGAPGWGCSDGGGGGPDGTDDAPGEDAADVVDLADEGDAPSDPGDVHDPDAPDDGPDAEADLLDPCTFVPPDGPPRTIPPIDDPRSAKEIYDEYFQQVLPDHDDFGWEDAPWITAEWVESLHYPTPPAGLPNELYHNYFDFNPFNFRRPGLEAFARDDDNSTLFAATTDPEEIFRLVDPTEWMPAAATTYTRTATSDVMAEQFYYRLTTRELRPFLLRALELCPDCDDVYTPLSHDDLYKIIELRFVRYVDGHPPQVSRVFKLIGVDSSGALESHARNDDFSYFGTIDGVTVRAKWRMELSGALAQKYWNTETDTYVRLMPVLVRASETAVYHQYYDGRFDREGGGPDDPYARLYNTAADGQCIRDCHSEYCQAGRDVEGFGYYHASDCSCGSLYDPYTPPLPDDVYSSGTCEAWEVDAWPEHPSSYACGG
jgi:hypothetical protein